MVAFIALLLVHAVLALAQEFAPEDQRVHVEAGSVVYEEATETVRATGGVVIRRGDVELRAAEVELNRTTGEAEARGHVVITEPDGALFADALSIRLDDETGWLKGAEVRSQRYRFSLIGDRIEKGLGQRYRIENGTFTTCLCGGGPPSWSISGKKVDVDIGGFGRLEGGTFNVLGQPLIYLPRAWFPVARERQSGFLLPHFGFSNRRGFQAIVPFYWALSRSHDATFAADLETNARGGFLGEYRYALTQRTAGEVQLSYFNEFLRGAERRAATTVGGPVREVPRNRWSLGGQHSQSLPLGAQGYADLFLVSDDHFLREINIFRVDYRRDVANRTRRYTESRVGVVRNWGRAALALESKYYQDLVRGDALTFQRVPQLRAWGQRLFGDRAHASAELDLTGFQRSRGVDGFRFDARPVVWLPLRTPWPVYATARLGLRETAYALTEQHMVGGFDPASHGKFVLHLPSFASRQIFEAGPEVASELSRVYRYGEGGAGRLRHTIEPFFAYQYVPEVEQSNLPVFDDNDRVNHRNLVTFGVASRLLAKDVGTGGGQTAGSVPAVRELGSLSVAESYDISRTIPPVGEPAGGPGSDHFSDIDVAVRANPARAASISVRSSYDASDGDISAAAVSLRLSDPRQPAHLAPTAIEGRSALSLGYRIITQNILHQVDASLLLHLTDFLGFFYATRYDVKAAEILENHFGIRLLSLCDCWGFDLAFNDRTNPQEVEVRAQLTLVGLGSSPRAAGLP